MTGDFDHTLANDHADSVVLIENISSAIYEKRCRPKTKTQNVPAKWEHEIPLYRFIMVITLFTS